MIVFHFTRDLEFFGLIEPGTTLFGGWAVFARLIAGAFVFLSGISLVLAHGAGFRPRAWGKRMAQVVAAAVLVSAATYIAFPGQFIYFGILQLIAVASVLGLAVLRAPGWFLAGLACAVLAIASAPVYLFDTPWLGWTGLSASVRPSMDHLPLIPWLGVFLGGMAAAKLLPVTRWDVPFGHSRWLARLTWPGRHSLAVYLLHQPVLLGVVWLYTSV